MEIKPFRAVRFDKTKVASVGDCIAPPYDVIDDKLRQQLYEKSEYNIVRIINGKKSNSDNETNNQYTRAAGHFNSWLECGALKKDSADAIYAYVQDFQVAGEKICRSGFISLAKLAEFTHEKGGISAHEQTLDKPKIDRLNLTRATEAQFGLIFMLYEDQQQIADKIIEKAATQEALIDFADEQNVRHRLFAINDKNEIEQIEKMLLDKNCIIADGHHRYETALNYRKESKNPAADYQMVAMVNTNNAGLVVLATHRLAGNMDDFDFEKFLTNLKENFKITEYRFENPQEKSAAKEKMLEQMKSEQKTATNVFGIYGSNGAFYAASLEKKEAMDSAATGRSDNWKALDVSVLHKLLIEKHLGLDEAKVAAGGNIEYVKDTGSGIAESIEKIDNGQMQVAFFMNSPTTREIKSVTQSGEKMPQKSTFFYPKMYTGLTINKL